MLLSAMPQIVFASAVLLQPLTAAFRKRRKSSPFEKGALVL
jgi:hypothetical protein